jgi:multidrug efflux system membrane fusion protein
VKIPARNLLLGVGALAVIGWIAHATLQSRSPAPGTTGAAARAVPVRVEVATRSDLDVNLDIIGRAEAFSTVNVRSRVSGQLDSLAFTPGKHVRLDEVIAKIDPTLFAAQVRQAEGNLARDHASLTKAQADLVRYEPVAKLGFISKAELDGYRAVLEVAKATVQADQAALELARTQLEYTTIKSPLDGVAGAPLVYPGAQITADTTDIVVINQTHPIHITFALPEARLDNVKRTMAEHPVKVDIRPPGAAEAIAGVLDFIDNAVDPTTGTILLKARVENTDDRLTPGQFLTVTLPTAHLTNAVSVPIESLQNSATGPFLFIVKDDNTVEQRPVTPGPTTGRRLVIAQGLEGGERVVTDGQLLLVAGTRVNLINGNR